DGAIESTVSSAMSWIARSETPPLPPPRLMLMSWASAGVASATAAIRVVRIKTLRGGFGSLTKTMTSDGQAARPFRLRGFQNWSWLQRGRPAARRARAVVAAARARPAGPRWPGRQGGEARLRDAAPSRPDSGLRSRVVAVGAVAEEEAQRPRVQARASVAPWPLRSGAATAAASVRCAASFRAAWIRCVAVAAAVRAAAQDAARASLRPLIPPLIPPLARRASVSAPAKNRQAAHRAVPESAAGRDGASPR